MLKLYHQPISFNSRRPWIALLEKGLDFELIEMQLNGDQFQPEFVALNPFHLTPPGDSRHSVSLAVRGMGTSKEIHNEVELLRSSNRRRGERRVSK